MSKLYICSIVLLLVVSCKSKKEGGAVSLQKINRDTAIAWINHYSDTTYVSHAEEAIVRALYLSSADLEMVSNETDSVKFFTAANPANHKVTFIVQTVARHSPASYTYYRVESLGSSSLCPPPNDCISIIEPL
jgi:hypothetical protein